MHLRTWARESVVPPLAVSYGVFDIFQLIDDRRERIVYRQIGEEDLHIRLLRPEGHRNQVRQ
jgi:hypothetical protein